MQVQINNLSLKVEKIGTMVINSTKAVKDSLDKAENVLKLEGIKAGLATATQKQILGDRIFPLIKRIYPEGDRAAKLTGMMLEKNNEKILKMLENNDYLTRQAKAAVDVLQKKK